MRPYIGITGFVHEHEVGNITAQYRIGEKDPFLMLGLLVSEKTFRGEKNRYPNRYPAWDKAHFLLQYAYSERQISRPYLHYNTDTEPGDPKLLYELLALTVAYKPIRGIQLNICWPKVETMSKFVSMTGDAFSIILQVGSRALEAIEENPKKLASRLKEYEGVLAGSSYILIDPSGGVGRDLNIEDAEGYLRAIYDAGLHQRIGIGVAGGFSDNNIERIAPLVEQFPNLSIDAEGKLRDKEDNLDWDKASRYANAALELYRRARQLEADAAHGRL